MITTNKKLILFTAHRRENFGQPLLNIFSAIKRIVQERDDILIIYPVHPNPNIKVPAEKNLGNVKNIILIPPVDYPTLAYLLSKSYVVLTDSGGIQEETPTFGVPVFVLREKTEREEGIQEGISKLLGSDKEKIYYELNNILNNQQDYKKMAPTQNPYGDGKASKRILNSIKDFLYT
jgi:UDP-N-acetylglucosamine 2-epimerase (non-hydrolysing)